MENISTINNLKQLFNRLSQFPDLFILLKQTCENVDEYFENLGYSNLPFEFLAFISLVDGLKLGGIQFFSISNNEKFVSLTFKDYSSKNAVLNYCSNWEKNKNYFFFASDSRGGRFVFDLSKNDNLVYYINPSNVGATISYGSFIGWLSDNIEKTIQNSI